MDLAMDLAKQKQQASGFHRQAQQWFHNSTGEALYLKAIFVKTSDFCSKYRLQMVSMFTLWLFNIAMEHHHF